MEGPLAAIFGTASGAFPGLEVVGELGRGAETVVYRVRRGAEEYAVKLFTGVNADPARALTRPASVG